MIIVQTPLRISFLGGGTDFPDFYATEPGAVLSTTIDKYVYVILKERFDDFIRIGYTRTEMVEDVPSVEHDLVREAMRLTGIQRGIEISTMADIPSRGSGLGSSSTVTVGLLHAMWVHEGILPSRRQLADGACEIEVHCLRRPIGKQDQYAAAYGGLRYISFSADGIHTEPAADAACSSARLGERLMLFFTGITRKSSHVLSEQKASIEDKRPALRQLRELADEGRNALQKGNLDAIGELMHQNWEIKRKLASRVTNDEIDAMYADARKAGVVGGKISGAGGGGFMLLYCHPEHQEAVRAALHGLWELEFNLEPHGSHVLLNTGR